MMGQKYFPTFKRMPIAIGRWLVRIAPKVGFGLLVLFVLVAIPWTYFNIKWGRELEAELAALKAQGMPLTMVEAAPKPVPDDQNAAVVYQEVFRVHFPPEKTLPDERMKGLSNEELGLFYEYLKEPNAEREEQMRTLLGRPQVQEALETFRRGSQRPHCVFPVNWQDGVGALFPHLGRFREASRIIAAQALILAKDGRLDEALDWCEVALRMSEHAASEPSLIGQLVSYAMQNITFGAVKQIVSAAETPPATAEKFQRYLRQIDLYKTFTGAMIGERTFGRYMFDMLSQKPRAVCKLVTEDTDLRVYPLLVRLYCGWLGRPVHKLDELAYLEYMQRDIEITKLPYREAAPKFEAQATTLKTLPKYLIVTRVASPVFSRASGKRDMAVANIGLCRVVLALKTYKYERGAYPETLEQLKQTLDWKLPEDPFSGQDFVYRRQGEGFILYSIGQDLEDDGGLPGRDERGKWHDDRDIVWECIR